MIQKGKNREFRTINHIIVDSEIAQSVNTFPEFNILGSYLNFLLYSIPCKLVCAVFYYPLKFLSLLTINQETVMDAEYWFVVVGEGGYLM
jgi:hypothetical protein